MSDEQKKAPELHIHTDSGLLTIHDWSDVTFLFQSGDAVSVKPHGDRIEIINPGDADDISIAPIKRKDAP